jgi:hypothetical protein
MLSVEQVKARATSPLAALEVSIEVWVCKANLPDDELRNAPMGHGVCGFCQYYGKIEIYLFVGCAAGGHGECPLSVFRVDGQVCCPEYNEASQRLEKHKDGIASASQVRSAFWAMVARLEKEKEKLEAAFVLDEHDYSLTFDETLSVEIIGNVH